MKEVEDLRGKRRNKALTRNEKLTTERARRAALQAMVIEYLKEHPCVDCGETDPIVLDFDHVRGVKRQHVTYMISHQWGKQSVLDEIEKCDVRCANCHRRRTAQTQGWARAAYLSGGRN